jgi:hypothetical protein
MLEMNSEICLIPFSIRSSVSVTKVTRKCPLPFSPKKRLNLGDSIEPFCVWACWCAHTHQKRRLKLIGVYSQAACLRNQVCIKTHVSLSDAWTISTSIRAMGSIPMKESSNRIHCQHEYPDNTWKCGKCGYQILPDLLGKIAETGSGRIMSTTVQ